MASARAIEAGKAILRVAAVEDGVQAVLQGVLQDVQSTARGVRNVGIALAATGAGAMGH